MTDTTAPRGPWGRRPEQKPDPSAEEVLRRGREAAASLLHMLVTCANMFLTYWVVGWSASTIWGWYAPAAWWHPALLQWAALRLILVLLVPRHVPLSEGPDAAGAFWRRTVLSTAGPLSCVLIAWFFQHIH